MSSRFPQPCAQLWSLAFGTRKLVRLLYYSAAKSPIDSKTSATGGREASYESTRKPREGIRAFDVPGSGRPAPPESAHQTSKAGARAALRSAIRRRSSNYVERRPRRPLFRDLGGALLCWNAALDNVPGCGSQPRPRGVFGGGRADSSSWTETGGSCSSFPIPLMYLRTQALCASAAIGGLAAEELQKLNSRPRMIRPCQSLA